MPWTAQLLPQLPPNHLQPPRRPPVPRLDHASRQELPKGPKAHDANLELLVLADLGLHPALKVKRLSSVQRKNLDGRACRGCFCVCVSGSCQLVGVG